MIQLYADDALVYDSRLTDTNQILLGLTAQLGLNKGGTATIIMPPEHNSYNAFTSYKTVVTIYRDGVLRFRGRALYPTDDFQLRRTITCEGERCFLRDGIMRSYSYLDTPETIFRDVINSYNAQVEEFKQFTLGTIEGISSDVIPFSAEEAEPILQTVDHLIERCGGQIVFTTNTEGKRTINWYADIGYRNNQRVEFGENMLSFSRTTANSDLATVIIPYGAMIEETNETTGEKTSRRLTIESVNDGKDYVEDAEAIALRGRITKVVIFDDILTASHLKAKAEAELASSKNLITSLELSAIDMALIDKSLDSFRVGDLIEVYTKPHGILGDYYQLNEQSLDFLYPMNERIKLGKSSKSLTGADVAGDKKAESDLKRTEQKIASDYQLNVAAKLEATRQELTSLIQQTSEAIKLEVAAEYTTGDALDTLISTKMTQLSDSFDFTFNTLKTTVDDNDAESRKQFEEIEKYIRFVDGNIALGEEGNDLTLRIENDRISFLDDGAEVAYFTNKQLTVTDGNFLNSLQLGKFAFVPRENGNLSLVRVGG